MRRVKLLNLFLPIVAMFTSQLLWGQSELTVSAPNVVSQSEVFRVVFTANGETSDFAAPSFEGFEVLAGPTPSTMSSTQIINGKRTHSVEKSYTFMLRPVNVGKFVIGQASATIDKQVCKSSPITVEVIKGEAKKSTPAAGDDLMLRIVTNKSSVVKGEPVVATIKLYVQNSSLNNLEDIRFPSFNGFWSQDIETISNISFSRENYNGQIYNSAVLKKVLLIPQQTGKLTIDPAELVCLIQVRSNQTPRSIFDDFFDSYQTIRKRVVSDKVNIDVAPLPAGAPASFKGAVGRFSMEVSLSTDSLNAHEAASLKVAVSGRGNLNLIETPSVLFPADFESYDVKKTDKIDAGADGFSGVRVFEYPFIPRSQGEFEIAPVEFSYYDIQSKEYRTLKSPAKSLSVGAGKDSQATVIQGVGKQNVKNLNEDIRFIATSSDSLKKRGSAIVASPVMYVCASLIVLIFFVVSFFVKRNMKLRSDIAGTKNRKAKKVAKGRLKNCEMFLKQSLKVAFYEELHKAVEGYISDKLMLPMADLSRENIKDQLVGKGASLSLVQELFDLLDACEFARYAPSADSSSMEKDYQSAVKIISELES